MIIHVESKQVASCSECPFYHEEHIMGAKMDFCSKIGILEFYDYLGASTKVYHGCPYLNQAKKPCDTLLSKA